MKVDEIREREIKKIKNLLTPQWLLDDGVVMYDPKHNALVISPTNALKHGITNIQVAQNRLGSRTILHFRLDWNLIDRKERR